jgi:putative MATE family efflux protein
VPLEADLGRPRRLSVVRCVPILPAMQHSTTSARSSGDSSAAPLLARTSSNREILALALLALGALMAEPLYVLVDTAIIGHLGRAPMAALGVVGVVLANVFANFNFLTYATTAQVGRARGAGMADFAGRVGAQALWLWLPLGFAVAGGVFALAGPIASLMGAHGETAAMAVAYLRIAAGGMPFAFIAMGAQGYLRGLGDLKTPLVIIGVANVANVVLELCFVYAFGWGVKGSAAATTFAQVGMGVSFVYRARGVMHAGFDVSGALQLLCVGRRIFVRSASLHAAIVVAAAVATRFGDASIAAHQIGFQLWTFLALALDSLAVAGQVIVARDLGAGAREAVFATATRLIRLGIVLAAVMALVVAALYDVLPRAFTGDAAVISRAHAIWPVFVVVLPISGAVYALEGVLLGAGDVRYLMWTVVAAAGIGAAFAGAALVFGWGLVGVWLALATMNTVRLATASVRFRRRRWAVVGAEGVIA